MADYITKEGDILDDVTFRFYGEARAGLVESVLELNQGLASYGVTLPADVTIKFPAVITSPPMARKRLWT
jgi:phage tail protein X